jgi:hypothetical protein
VSRFRRNHILSVLSLTLVGAVAVSHPRVGSPAETPAGAVRFAVIGDYGLAGQSEEDVANLVKSWNPEFIITVGDNNYFEGTAETIDANIGQYYHEFIHPYVGSYGPGADTNRFFPTMGNDWGTLGGKPYFDYFTLPGNERYYEFVRGPVHLFALDSMPKEPDGNTSTSVQAQWLQARMAASTAPWKVVYFHQAPYASTSDGGKAWMRWPFKEWGATVVMAGNYHHYERLSVDGLTYFINGLGGRGITPHSNTPAPGSQVRYKADYGAMLVDATDTAITFKFISRAGVIIDTYAIERAVSQVGLTLSPESVVGGKSATGTVSLARPAPPSGARVQLSSSNTSVATVPSSVTLAEGTTSKTFKVTAATVASPSVSRITAAYVDGAGAADLTVSPPQLSGLTLSPANITAPCKVAAGKVTLTGKAPAGGVLVNMANTNAAASVPAAVTVPAGATQLSFEVTASEVNAKTSGTVTATPADANFGTTPYAKALTVLPNGVAALSMPSPVTGPQTLTATVTLACPARAGGQAVALSTSKSSVARPVDDYGNTITTVTVPGGQSSGTFKVFAAGVSAPSSATIKAKANEITKSFVLTVNP